MIEKVTVVRHTNMRVNERTFRVTEKKKKRKNIKCKPQRLRSTSQQRLGTLYLVIK